MRRLRACQTVLICGLFAGLVLVPAGRGAWAQLMPNGGTAAGNAAGAKPRGLSAPAANESVAQARVPAVVEPSPGRSAPQPPLPNHTLRSELKAMLESHPRIVAARSRASAAREDVRRAYSGYLPRLQLSGDAGREVIDSPTTRSTRNGTSTEFREKATMALTENLFSGFGTVEEHSRTKVQEEIADWNVKTTEQALLLEGITAYYSVLRQRRLLALARQNEQILKDQLQLEDERVLRGSGIAVDVLLAKTRLQLAVERRVQLVGQLDEAIARYIQVFGHEPDVSHMAEPDLIKPTLPAGIDNAIRDAKENNPSLMVTTRQIDAARHLKNIAASGFYPRVDLVGQLNWENDVDAVEGVRRDWSVMLRMSWELFSGFETSARTSSAAFEQMAAKDTHLDTTRKVLEELRIAWQQLSTARERVSLLENAVVIAEEVFKSRQRLRDAGRETAINVLDAQSEVFGARINHVAALFDAQVAVFRVLFATGMLTAEHIGL